MTLANEVKRHLDSLENSTNQEIRSIHALLSNVFEHLAGQGVMPAAPAKRGRPAKATPDASTDASGDASTDEDAQGDGE